MPYLERLKMLKEERDLTNAEIAKLSNIPLATITRVFNGQTANPTFETFAQIAVALGVSLDEIAGLKMPDTPMIEATTSSYLELVKEKDARLKEKDDIIAMLKERGNQDQKERKRLLWFIGTFVCVIVFVLLFDMLNGHIGYIRY